MTNTSIRAFGQLLRASDDDRVLTYRLLPYGEQGRTSSGLITASKGSVTLPEDAASLIGNFEHDGTRPASRAVSVEETDEGLDLTVRVLGTNAGNDLLIEAREGVRTGVSVEIEDPVIRKGALVAGSLTGYGHVTRPAFPSAQLVASDTEPDTTPQSEAPADDINTQEEGTVDDNATTPEYLVASKNGVNPGKASNTDIDLKAFSRLVASGNRSTYEPVLKASLTDIPAGNGYDGGTLNDITVPTFLGELWSGKNFTQRFAPLVSHQTFTPGTSGTVYGWRFTDKLSVDDWAGFPNQVPTDTLATELVTAHPAKLAGGWVFDRDFADSGNAGFIEAALRQATDDYARKIDGKVITAIAAASTAVSGAPVVDGVAPATTRIVKGIRALLTDEASLTPEWAIVGADLYEALLYTKKDNVLEYLEASIGLDGGSLGGFRIVVSNRVADNGKVYVGCSQAITLFEYAGAPVRVDALDVARGGIEVGLYGKWATIAAGKGIVSVS
jgi:hypothetical protein